MWRKWGRRYHNMAMVIVYEMVMLQWPRAEDYHEYEDEAAAAAAAVCITKVRNSSLLQAFWLGLPNSRG